MRPSCDRCVLPILGPSGQYERLTRPGSIQTARPLEALPRSIRGILAPMQDGSFDRFQSHGLAAERTCRQFLGCLSCDLLLIPGGGACGCDRDALFEGQCPQGTSRFPMASTAATRSFARILRARVAVGIISSSSLRSSRASGGKRDHCGKFGE